MSYNIGVNHHSPPYFLVRLPALSALLAFAALLCLSVALPSGVAAQGAGLPGLVSQSRTGPAGPYAVVADARELPSLQAVQFFIRVRDPEGDAPVAGLQVTVHTSRRGGEETGWAHAFSPNEPGLYQATVALEEVGVWEMAVEIADPAAGADGESWFMASDSFVFETVAPTTDQTAGFVFIGVALVLLVGAGYLTWRVRQNQKRRAQRYGGVAP